MHQFRCKTAPKARKNALKTVFFRPFLTIQHIKCPAGQRQFAQNRRAGHGHFTTPHLLLPIGSPQATICSKSCLAQSEIEDARKKVSSLTNDLKATEHGG